MRYLEESNSQKQKVEWRLPGGGRRGNGELGFSRYRVSAGAKETVLMVVKLAQKCECTEYH